MQGKIKMTKKECVLDSLVDGDEAKTQILEYFQYAAIDIIEDELQLLLNEMLSEGSIVINLQWKNEKNEYPYSLTQRGRDLWELIEEWIDSAGWFYNFKVIISEDEKQAIIDYVTNECELVGHASIANVPLGNIEEENYQIEWYIKNFDIGYYYEREKVEDMLVACDVKPKDAKSIFKAYKRIVDTPFGINLNFGQASDDEIVRLKWSISDNRVVLYALYKFVEKCNLDDREFHLSYLFDEEVERDGISPVRMFGIYDEEEWKSILLGLSARYPEFINATFTKRRKRTRNI